MKTKRYIILTLAFAFLAAAALQFAGCNQGSVADRWVKKSNKHPKDVNLHLNAGDALLDEKRYEDAFKQYDAAVKLIDKDPKKNKKYYFNAWNSRGVSLFDLKRYDEAIADFTKLLELPDTHGEDNSLLHSNIAMCYHEKKDFAQAEKWYNEALKLNPKNDKARLGMAMLKDDMRQAAALKMKGGGKALDALKAQVDKKPGDTALRLKLADGYDKAGMFKDAAAQYEKLIELQGKDVSGDALTALARIDFELRDYKAALPVLQKMLAATPDDSVIYRRIGDCYQELKQPDLARQSYEKALAIDPANDLAKQGMKELGKLPGAASGAQPAPAASPK